jgi:hypothetical protein
VVIELQVEDKEAGKVAALGVDGPWRLAGNLGHEVRRRERAETVLALGEECLNVMLLIILRNQPWLRHIFR